jgi:hypothetical protein
VLAENRPDDREIIASKSYRIFDAELRKVARRQRPFAIAPLIITYENEIAIVFRCAVMACIALSA